MPNFQSPVPRSARSARLINTVHDVHFLHAPQYFGTQEHAALVEQFQLTRDNADGIVFISETSRAQFNGFYGPAPADWVVPPIIPAHRPERPAAEAREPVLLAVAHQDHHPHKNIAGVIALFAALAARDPELRLVMTGHGRDAVLARLPLLPSDIRARLTHAGYVSRVELDALFDRARALISLSFSEGFDMPAAEGAIRGTPLVLSDIPVHRDLFGDRALLVDAGRPSVEAVAAFLARPPAAAPWPFAERCSAQAVGAAMATILDQPAPPQRPAKASPTILFAQELGGGSAMSRN